MQSNYKTIFTVSTFLIIMTALVSYALINVQIDIRPGNQLNQLNIQSNALVPVGILSTSGFDATKDVNVNSLTFRGSGIGTFSIESTNAKRDINKDKLPDLIVNFRTVSGAFSVSDSVGVLSGETNDGEPIIGTDSVNVK